MHLDLMRHGEPEGGRRYRGHRDDPLSATGWAQMRRAAYGRQWTRIVTSPLARCQAFATALAAERGIPCTTEPRFMELAYGDWEGLTPEQVRNTAGDLARRFFADPLSCAPPGAEPVAGFLQRVAAAYTDLTADAGSGDVLVVTHAGVIRALVLQLLDAPPQALFRIHVDYAQVTRFDIGGGRRLLVRHGG